MKKATPIEIVMIAVVRADQTVGRGNGSSIDALSNEDLLDLLRRRGAEDAEGAVRVAHEHEEMARISAEAS